MNAAVAALRGRLMNRAAVRAEVLGLGLSSTGEDHGIVQVWDLDAPKTRYERTLREFESPARVLYEFGLLDEVTPYNLGVPQEWMNAENCWVAMTTVADPSSLYPELSVGVLMSVRTDGVSIEACNTVAEHWIAAWSDREAGIPRVGKPIALDTVVEVVEVKKRDCAEHSQYFDVDGLGVGCPRCGAGVTADCATCGMLKPCQCDVLAASLPGANSRLPPPDGDGWRILR